jgi:hypothetical protein
VDYWEIKVELTPDISFTVSCETLEEAVDSVLKKLERVNDA